MNYEEWLKQLKVGDSVIVVCTGGYKRVATVSAITPKGFIKVQGNLYSPISGKPARQGYSLGRAANNAAKHGE